MTLGAFLTSLRRRISRESRALGTYERRPSRYGKRVTQEEVAAAIGVSRVWYATLESDGALRTSTQMLSRLADVLTLSADERTRLFDLAIPDLRVGLSTESRGVLEAFSVMRAAGKRLWAASSESEALLEASEQLATWFRDARQIGSGRRLDAGIWESRLLNAVDARFEEVVREVADSLAAECVDDAHLFPQLLQPGEIARVFDLYSPGVRGAIDNITMRCGLGRGSFDNFIARVRSRHGLVACLGLFQETDRLYSETDRAVLSAVAEITSLALS